VRIGNAEWRREPRADLNRHDAKVAEDTGFRTLHRGTRESIRGAFRSFFRVPQVRLFP
jgi:hypothetical protein